MFNDDLVVVIAGAIWILKGLVVELGYDKVFTDGYLKLHKASRVGVYP